MRLRPNFTAQNRASETLRADASIGAESAGAAGAPAGGAADAGGRPRARSSWVLVGSLRESAQGLALAPVPEDADVCLAEAEDLLFARDRITCALADRVGRVHAAGRARQHGHASTRSWLRTAAGMSVGGAGRLLTLAVELARLPRVRERFAAGQLAAGVVEAICAATANLSDEHAGVAEPILLELATKAGAAEVAKAGRYLRAVLDPDGEDRDERAEYGRRFLRVRPGRGGGLEGEFSLPREAAARLLALLDAYAKPRAEGDDRPLSVRQADAFIALLEQKIATELLVLVNAESLPTDPGTDLAADDTSDSARDEAAATDHPADPDHARSTDDTSEADDGVPGAMGDPGDVGGADDPEDPDRPDTAEAETEADAGADGAADAGAGSDAGADGAADADAGSADRSSAGPRDEESRQPGPDERGAGEHGAYERGTGSCPSGTAPSGTAPSDAEQPDPPPEDNSAHHTHAGHRPARDCRHAQTTSEDHSDVRCGQYRHDLGRQEPDCDELGGEEQGRARQDAADGQGACRCGDAARCECATQAPGTAGTPGTGTPGTGTPGTGQGAPPGTPPGAPPGRLRGTGPGALFGTAPGALLGTALGMVPGLLLATGQMLPVTSVHRLARTSTLVRLVMDAEGQVLDMGRKVRLATPAQRRAIFARYATCWIDGYPLPATMCQIDHADDWCTGGLTDLKLLGPACQFHNRDRYQHPQRYTRRRVGTDRWAFTYHRLGATRLRK
ncbi:HNH endonuclease signature motif containing protein [Microbispora rosea]|uniref:HNH endonuclease signature motif containing protein n=1 Tax=Microbispora rosea TaxID=58117 RepID=UPI0037972A70